MVDAKIIQHSIHTTVDSGKYVYEIVYDASPYGYKKFVSYGFTQDEYVAECICSNIQEGKIRVMAISE